MVLVNKFDHLGIPPQLRSTLKGMNTVLTDLGFPKWTLVKWPVPPLMTFWLLLTLIMSGLRWFAMFEIMFILYKFFEDYGEPVSDWMNSGSQGRLVTRRIRNRSMSNDRDTLFSKTTTRSTSRSSPRKTPTTLEEAEDSES